MDKNNIVPFGKYKNQPIEALAQDTQYTEWLMNQDWFRSRFPELRTIIVNNFTEPSNTPEHNQMVAKFLDDDFCAEVISSVLKIYGKDKLCIGKNVNDWQDDEWEYEPIKNIRIVTKEFEHKNGSDVRIECHLKGESTGTFIYFGIECKPVMSDDFPQIIRQCRDQKTNILVIEEYTGVGATLDQIRKMFQDIMIYEI